MSDSNDKTKKGLTSKHSKWEREAEKIRKVQISLDFPDTADILLRTLAAREHKAPSSMIREIVGMPSSPPKRARIGVSFNSDELQVLGKRYNIDPTDKAEIRRKLTEEVTSVLISTESLVPAGSPVLTSSPGSNVSQSNSTDSNSTNSDLNEAAQGNETPASHLLTRQFDGDAISDLKTVSDSIHLRFQQALAKRNAKKPAGD